MLAAPPNPATAKTNGAFYTPAQTARFLVRWSVRSKTDRILDPSHGGGVFLREAFERLAELGGNPAVSVFGIELDPATHEAASQALKALGFPIQNLEQDDFFDVAERCPGQFDVVVGNPPFIRYQRFTGAVRERASALMRRAGVHTTELSSSWAPFVVCGAGLLRENGRLAMVVPMELCQAVYARPILEFLRRSFRTVQFLSFGERLFPGLSQETLLLLADGKGTHAAEFRWRHLRSYDGLSRLGSQSTIRGRRLNAEAFTTGRQRLVDQFLPARARDLYDFLARHELVRPLGAVADVGIGYVTGANGFFHLTAADIERWGIPAGCLEPAVCRGRALRGLRFTKSDWRQSESEGDAGKLLRLPRRGPLHAAVRRYIEHGEASGVHHAYKCRVRDPWYHVPHVYRPEAFLTYMSGVTPRLVANHARAVAPNTLHVVRMLPLSDITAECLAVAWRTSLTELSAELEGHALGGGMLKLEPREAGRVLLALPPGDQWSAQCETLDVLARTATPETLRATVDSLILRDYLDLPEKDCRCLRDAASVLRARRLGRSR